MKIEDIKNPSFLKGMSKKELQVLAEDIRWFLIENVSKTGGHLSSNLGVVELTIAMHYVFDSPKDKLLFDVGHQCYTHKILTGRAREFSNLRQFNGLSGFIKKDESEHDVWESGHSSTTLSAQCGFLMSQGVDSKNKVVALIGDSSISNGVSFEALNHMGTLRNLNPIIILNDNKMAISRSVGAISRSFSKLRSTKSYQKTNSFFASHTPRKIKKILQRLKTSIKGLILKENLFEDWGYDYMGPYDGNNLSLCIKMLNVAKQLNKPCVIHFVTTKGKGYKPAERDINGDYHGVGKFDIESGQMISNSSDDLKSYSQIMAESIERLIAKNPYFVITPAMIKGSALCEMKERYPHNIIDAGMAEEHATVMASSMAQAGQNVVLLLYSTFAQRAYDFILNDIARTNTHVIIGIDRADIVPGDGETHQGIYDISMFNSMPNIEIVMPKNGTELHSLMLYAEKTSHPIVVRYPKLNSIVNFDEAEDIVEPSWTIEKNGSDVIIITYGEGIDYINDSLKDEEFSYTLVNARFIKPIDEKMLKNLLDLSLPILIYENVSIEGGLTSNIFKYCFKNKFSSNIEVMGFTANDIIPCGDVESIRNKFNLGKKDIIKTIDNLIKNHI